MRQVATGNRLGWLPFSRVLMTTSGRANAAVFEEILVANGHGLTPPRAFPTEWIALPTNWLSANFKMPRDLTIRNISSSLRYVNLTEGIAFRPGGAEKCNVWSSHPGPQGPTHP